VFFYYQRIRGAVVFAVAQSWNRFSNPETKFI